MGDLPDSRKGKGRNLGGNMFDRPTKEGYWIQVQKAGKVFSRCQIITIQLERCISLNKENLVQRILHDVI
jgi:hypothetical protein